MGVEGLWSLIESCSQPINPASLRGKVLAVDVSIWLHQSLKGFRDKNGQPLPNAHILGLFHRISKLLHYGIRPVFVFDGGVPPLKKQTINRRKIIKDKATTRAGVARKKLLSNFIQLELAKNQNLSKLISDSRVLEQDTESKEEDKYLEYDGVKLDEDDISSEDGWYDDEGEIEGNNHNYADDFGLMNSSRFNNLSLESQHEILFQMQESKKNNSWKTIDQMPKDPFQFSSFQMDRLLKRRFLQNKIKEVQKEMGQRHIHVQNLEDELANYETEEVKQTQNSSQSSKLNSFQQTPSTSSQAYSAKNLTDSKTIDASDYVDFLSSSEDEETPLEELKNEDEVNLQLAIQLSLASSDSKSKSSVMRNSLNESPTIELSSDDETESRISKNAYSPRRRSVEYSPTKLKKNNATSIDLNPHPLAAVADDMTNPCYKFLGWVGFADKIPSPVKKSTINNPKVLTPSESDDEEFEDVEEKGDVEIIQDEEEKTLVQHLLKNHNDIKPQIQIQIKPNEVIEDDLFAEIFNESQNRSADITAYTPTPLSDETPIEILASSDPAPDSSKVIQIEDTEVEMDTLNESISASKPNPNSEIYLEKNKSSTDKSTAPTTIAPIFSECTSRVQTKVSKDNDKESPLSSSSSLNKEIETITIEVSQDKPHPQSTKTGENVRVLTKEYLQTQMSLNKEKKRLEMEIGAQDRGVMSLSEQIHAEAQELLALFGIPWVMSPMEAESQCAFLDVACLTDGTITDDSDVWLFGGRRVYKNFFSSGDKHVELYQSSNIQSKLNLDREKMILLAILLGSDYTDGIEGVGPVGALEILTEFQSESTLSTSPFDILVKFYEWWDNKNKETESTLPSNKVRDKFKKLKIRPGFPSRIVYDAYLNPSVDPSLETFRWAPLNQQSLVQFAKNKFGWEESKTDSILRPLLKAITTETKATQLTLDGFFSLQPKSSPKIKSKRLRRAVAKLKRGPNAKDAPDEVDLSELESESDTSLMPKKKRIKLKKVKEGSKVSATSAEVDNKEVSVSEEDKVLNEPYQPQGQKKSKGRNRIESIPQRIQAETDKRKKKAEAIKIFKKQKTEN